MSQSKFKPLKITAMGREIRIVPANWEHPKNEQGEYIPQFEEFYGNELNEWLKNHNDWLSGEHADLKDNPALKEEYPFYAQYGGDAPCVEYYRTEKWDEAELTHFQIYETVSEGTPISPVFASREEIANWLITQGYSETAAKKFSETGYAPSMVIFGGQMGSDIHSLDLLAK